MLVILMFVDCFRIEGGLLVILMFVDCFRMEGEGLPGQRGGGGQ